MILNISLPKLNRTYEWLLTQTTKTSKKGMLKRSPEEITKIQTLTLAKRIEKQEKRILQLERAKTINKSIEAKLRNKSRAIEEKTEREKDLERVSESLGSVQAHPGTKRLRFESFFEVLILDG